MKKVLVVWFVLIPLLEACKFKSADTREVTGVEMSLKDFFQRTDQRIPLISAHRGGPSPGYPENCLETFEHVAGRIPVLIECDVERAGDGTLILMHDETLDRTTTGHGKVRDFGWQELKQLDLVDNDGNVTPYKIPTLRQTLRWAKEQTLILTVDVKRSVAFEDVIAIIEQEDAAGQVVMITYTLGAAQKVHRLAPHLMLSVTCRNQQELDRLRQSGIPMDQVLAFTGTSEPSLDLYRNLHREGVYCILGTLGNLDRRALARGNQIYSDFVDRGADIIATDRPFEVAKVLSAQYDMAKPFRITTSEPL